MILDMYKVADPGGYYPDPDPYLDTDPKLCWCRVKFSSVQQVYTQITIYDYIIISPLGPRGSLFDSVSYLYSIMS